MESAMRIIAQENWYCKLQINAMCRTGQGEPARGMAGNIAIPAGCAQSHRGVDGTARAMKRSVRQEPKRIIVKIRVFPDEDPP